MVGAIAAVHKDKGFFAQAGGYEYPLVLAVAALATAVAGAGEYSLDHAFGWSLSGEERGIAAMVISLALGTAAVSTRTLRLPRRRDRRQATA